MLVEVMVNLDSILVCKSSSLRMVLSSQTVHMVQVCVRKYVKNQGCLPSEVCVVQLPDHQNEETGGAVRMSSGAFIVTEEYKCDMVVCGSLKRSRSLACMVPPKGVRNGQTFGFGRSALHLKTLVMEKKVIAASLLFWLLTSRY